MVRVRTHQKWSNPANSSISSGGPANPQGCVPVPATDAFLDNSSFTRGTTIVEVYICNAYVHNMGWEMTSTGASATFTDNIAVAFLWVSYWDMSDVGIATRLTSTTLHRRRWRLLPATPTSGSTTLGCTLCPIHQACLNGLHAQTIVICGGLSYPFALPGPYTSPTYTWHLPNNAISNLLNSQYAFTPGNWLAYVDYNKRKSEKKRRKPSPLVLICML